MCVWRRGFNLALDEVETSLPKGCVCVVWSQGFNLALDEVETSLPREVVTRLKPRFRENCTRLKVRLLGVFVLFGGKVLTLHWTRLKPRFRRWEVDEVETSFPREVVTRLEPHFRGVCWTRLKPRFRERLLRGWSLASEGGRLTRLKVCFLGVFVLFGGKVLTLHWARLKPRFRERLLRG